jgi:carboxyl-terminal processing protease
MTGSRRILLSGALVVATFCFGFSWRDLQKLQAPSWGAFQALWGAGDSGRSTMSAVQVFRGTYHKILQRSAVKLDPKELKYSAMEGMMASLGDPHTVFLPPEAAETFSIETTAKFVGVGARLSPDALGARVAVVFDDGPANRAGLKVGDWIIGVDGESVGGVELTKIVSKIRGVEGTFVTLKIMRPGNQDPIHLRIRRERVEAPTVSGRMLEGTKVGYIVLDSFSEPTGEQFAEKLSRLQAEGMKGLIVDVRDNPGGLLDTAVDVLSHFVEDKVVVKMRLKTGREEVVRSFSGQFKKFRLPTAVLIDSESASAAEIFAGVLRDYGLATLVGEHTFGKAAVQHMFRLKDNASAKITIAKYLLPSGFDVSRKVDEDGQYLSGGVKPDVEVELDYAKQPTIGDPASDNQLAAALKLVQSKIP